MNKILTLSFLMTLCGFGCLDSFAAPARGGERILIAEVTGWGTSFEHKEDIKNPDKFGASGQAGSFVVLEQLANEGNSKKENDKIVALVARTLANNGGEFMPMVLKCKQGNSGRWGGWTEYMSNEAVGTWLCADGKTGEDCLEDSDAYTVNEWDYLKSTVRKQLSVEDTTQITKTVSGLDEWHWWVAGDKREGNVIVAVVGYTPSSKGVFAAPVSVRCLGNRGGNWFNSFDGKFGEFTIVGNKKLLCSAGYKPNSGKTDCEKIVDQVLEEASRPKISIEAPDGTMFTYDKEREMRLIRAQQARNGYDATIHSVYQYSTNPSNPKFAVFCKDTMMGLVSDDPLKCAECTSDLRRGVCLSKGKDNFGLCKQCAIGEIYDLKECKCKTAVTYSMSDLEYGKGKKKVSGVDACWAQDDDEDYKKCVSGTTTTDGASGSTCIGGTCPFAQ